jgi:excisionase family DNA binding protein
MVQGYYTLQEAAQVLGIAPEELKQMAQRNQIRSFQDRGTWRFRVQDIQELARQRGASSDLDLVLGEGNVPRSTDSPMPKSPRPKSPPPKGPPSAKHTQAKSSPPKSPQSPQHTPKQGAQPIPEVFDFALDEASGRESPSGRHKGRPDSKRGGPASPPPPGSDSDVRLVADSAAEQFVFDIPPKGSSSDSDVKLVGSDAGARKSPMSPRPKSPQPRKSALAPESPVPKPGSKPGQAGADSDARLVPIDSDSDVKIVGTGSDEVALGEPGPKSPTDSDIRLESAPPMGRSDEGLLTEDINLDEELKKQESLSQQKPQAKVKPKSKMPKFPTSSPFELSESQMKPAPAAPKPDSSDFDLTPAKPDSSDFDLSPGSSDSSSDDFSLDVPEESDISLAPGGSSGELKGPSSGISLDNPVDAGISLEQGGEGSDEIEFELSLDAEATPKPAPAKDSGDSSEFELSLDVDDKGAALESPSDSEFELTLDDSGGLAPLEEGAPQLKAGQDKDIFETDFEVPALEEESGSQVAALDTDLDSSDFDLALGDSEVAAEEDSGSQVVALDEEEADEAASTVAAKRRPGAGADLAAADVDFEQLGDDGAPEIEIEEEAEAAAVGGPAREVVREKVLRPAPWGALPVVIMLPCVIIMFLVGLMGFEMVQHMTGYQPPGFMTKTIFELIGQKPK